MTTPDGKIQNFSDNKEDPILRICPSSPSLSLEDFSSGDPVESPFPVPPDPLLSPDVVTKRKPPCSHQLIQLFFNEHPITKEVKDLDVFLYLHEDFLPSSGYLSHKPETFQSLLRIKNLILQSPRSLASSWSHYQQEESEPQKESPAEPFEKILVSLCQTIPSFHYTPSIHQISLGGKQKEKTHLIHLSDDGPEEESKIKKPFHKPISLALIIEKLIHQLT